MPAKKKDARNYLNFEEVYNYAYAAIGKLDQRYEESRDSNQRLELSRASAEIENILREIREAEIVHINSSTNDPVAELHKAIRQAKNELRKLEKLNKALKAAQNFLSILTRVINVVL